MSARIASDTKYRRVNNGWSENPEVINSYGINYKGDNKISLFEDTN
jgi:hypothetical protein